MTPSAAIEKLLALLRQAVEQGTLVKLTLSRYRGEETTLRKLIVRPVTLKGGPRLSFVYRHATRDITKNFLPGEGLAKITEMLGNTFVGAHLFTIQETAELELRAGEPPRLVVGLPAQNRTVATGHDRDKQRLIQAQGNAWLTALGVTTPEGNVCAGMEAKFRQINKFVELLSHLLAETPVERGAPLTLVDMGCGKGYLTFAAYEWLRRAGWPEAKVLGIEARGELVDRCNRVTQDAGFSGLQFQAGTIDSVPVERADILVALHACDTATDDAIAKGIQGAAALIVAAPCCHKELRAQLRPPPVLAGALRHGILCERQAEFVTDALRAALLEWAGYDTKVFEFIATEHTAKNLMIAAVKRRQAFDRDALAQRVSELASFYGIRTQRLARQLNFELQAVAGP